VTQVEGVLNDPQRRLIRRETANGVVTRRFNGKAIDHCGQLKRGSNRAINPAQDQGAARLADADGCGLQSTQTGTRNVIDPLEIDDQPAVPRREGFTYRSGQLHRRLLRNPPAKRQDRDALGTTHRDTKRPTQNL
jgi:hypothetical protein